MLTWADITICGHVGKDPVTPSANYPNFVTFSVAVSEKSKDKTNKEDKTIWYGCQTGSEFIAKGIRDNIKAGMGVLITGTPHLNSYTDKNGTTHTQIKINVSKFYKLNDPKNKVSEETVTTTRTSNNSFSDNNLEDDEIPF